MILGFCSRGLLLRGIVLSALVVGPLTGFAFGAAPLKAEVVAGPREIDEEDVPSGHLARPKPASGQESSQFAEQRSSVVPEGVFTYTTRPGDTLSSIAEIFGLQLEELARANHLDSESILRVGQALKIPNPYVSRIKALTAQLKELSDKSEAITRRAVDAQSEMHALGQKVNELKAVNEQVRRDVRKLPWWRAAAVSAGIALLLMFGVTLLALVQWLVMRRGMRALVEANESLRRLDQKYHAVLAKAELRFQQLYGRRVQGQMDREKAKLPEENEIDLLDHELKILLQEHLARLGGPTQKPGRRSLWREFFGGLGEQPVEARSARR